MLIQTHSELFAFCERLRNARVVALDMEFVSEGRYYPVPCTIQMAGGDELALIDLLSVTDITPLHRVLLDPDVTTVCHAGKIDLQILYRMLGRPVSNVFDTQLAASLLGYGDQISLLSLLKITLAVEIKKDYTFTDWTRRPLTSGQIEYALNDVRYLIPVYEKFSQTLLLKGRTDWARDEFTSLGNVENLQPRDERECYKRVEGANRLNHPELALLQESAAWRELKARDLNIPVRRVVADPVLIQLARRPCVTVRQLAQVRGLNSGQIDKFGQEIIRVLKKGSENTAEPIKADTPLPSEFEATVDFLSLCMRSLAQEQSISTGILGNRSELREIVKLGDDANVSLLRGWRREVVGLALLGALAGDASVRVSSATKQVDVHWAPCDSLA